jgi:hypothetical protein
MEKEDEKKIEQVENVLDGKKQYVVEGQAIHRVAVLASSEREAQNLWIVNLEKHPNEVNWDITDVRELSKEELNEEGEDIITEEKKEGEKHDS